MDEQMLQDLADVVVDMMAKQGEQISQEQAMQEVAQLMEAAQSDEGAAAQLQELVRMAEEKSVRTARHGAKLNYMRNLQNYYGGINYYACGGGMRKKITKSQGGNQFKVNYAQADSRTKQAYQQNKQQAARQAQWRNEMAADKKKQAAQQQATAQKARMDASRQRQEATNAKNARVAQAQAEAARKHAEYRKNHSISSELGSAAGQIVRGASNVARSATQGISQGLSRAKSAVQSAASSAYNTGKKAAKAVGREVVRGSSQAMSGQAKAGQNAYNRGKATSQGARGAVQGFKQGYNKEMAKRYNGGIIPYYVRKHEQKFV